MALIANKLNINASLSPDLQAKTERIVDLLCNLDSLMVAYSGGVDSALVLKVATEVLGPERAVGCLAISPSVPPREVELAKKHAQEMGARLITTSTNEMEKEGYVQNSPDRCYFCKSTLYTTLLEIGEREGFHHIANGFNVDDKGDHRPGQRAGKELNVLSPLFEAGFTKQDIRELSKALGLPTWNKPAAACLSSRIPYGTHVTVEALEKIGRAEEILQDLGFSGARVRHHGDVARIEVPVDQIGRFLDDATRKEISRGLHAVGYAYVTLDLDGYRTGSLNELIFKRRKDQ
ncbi:MAG TPA: ATP-dependent sacrificial sulfur transferase LarE [Chloroflexia bacterium]|nr:ATP-dependent sacrificial sulfur transferase LarE [Chloroflexia bacterium]